MTDFEIRTIAARPAVVSHHATDLAGFARVVDRGFPALYDRLGELRVAPAGPPFVRYLELGDPLRVQLGVPVAAVADDDGQGADVLPGGRAAIARHVGAYDGLEAAGRALHAWVLQRGETPAGSFWESYVTDPGEEPDPARRVTEIVIPLR